MFKRIFKNMKIRRKLWFGFGLIFSDTIFIAGVGIFLLIQFSLNLNYLLNSPIYRHNYLQQQSLEIMNLRRIAATIPSYIGETDMLRQLQNEAIISRDRINQIFNAYQYNLQNDVILLRRYDVKINAHLYITNEINQLTTRFFDEVILGMYISGIANNSAQMPHYMRLNNEIYNELTVLYSDWQESLLYSLEYFSSTIRSVGFVSTGIIVGFTIFGIITGLLILRMISKRVLNPIKDVVEILENVAEGNFDINMREDLPKDEIGMMTKDAYNVVSILKGMIDDFRKFVYEATVNGNLELRVDADKYKGGYRELVKEINFLSDTSDTDMFTLLNMLDKVNKGDFNAEIEKLPGQKIILNETVDALMANLKSIRTEIDTMIEAAAVKGNLKFKIDSSRFEGDWCSIMNGLNDVAVAVYRPIAEIRDTMATLNAGKFDTMVKGEYAGDFHSIKSDVNQVITGLAEYIREIDECLSAIASGNLTRNIAMNFDGDFNTIKESINYIVKTLHKTMSEINSASSQVLYGTRLISDRAADLAAGAQQQAGSVEELNVAIDIINKQTHQNADNASEAGNLALKSTSNAKQGNESMTEMLAAMSQIKESSKSISTIMKVIQDIAFQTNVLSLNAAVEAARAGEQGKGFGVVAEEVRILANRSETAATKTTELITDSVSRIETGAGIAESTATSLSVIVRNAGEVASYVKHISVASKEQAESISQVSEGLSQISKVVQTNMAVSEETAAASQELNSQAEILQQLVSFFKL